MGIKIVAVTACPVGVAHTYMAAEALSQAAKAHDCEIKVETNGASGIDNELTQRDIIEADAVIVACDKTVDVERFIGKPVIEVSVGAGLRKADELIQHCIRGDIPIKQENVDGRKHSKSKNFGWSIFKHLMNGVSHMLPLVVAGGIITAISFIWGVDSANPASPQYNEIAETFYKIGTYAMQLMIPFLAGYIAKSISGRAGLIAGFFGGGVALYTGSGFLGGLLAGFLAGYLCKFLLWSMRNMPKDLEAVKSMFIIPIVSILIAGLSIVIVSTPCEALTAWLEKALAGLEQSNGILLGIAVGCMIGFDLGGPVNKAAYITGTVLLASGNTYFMAGVSSACMTPPLVIALSATFFKSRFSRADRTAGLVNYILSFTHITEGAIPYAAKNPLVIIPIFMVSSSVSAALTYVAGISVPAPHGGFLVLPLVNNPLLWVVCVFAGGIVGMILYVIATPKVTDKSKKELKN